MVTLLVAVCNDGYHAYYPRDMMQAHHPLLVLTIDGLTPHDWARKAKQEDPGPYLIVYDHFQPAWKVLAHEDKPQLPTNVTRLAYEREAVAFARLAPAPAEANRPGGHEGFQIARQNCPRCHAADALGGPKYAKSLTTMVNATRDRR